MRPRSLLFFFFPPSLFLKVSPPMWSNLLVFRSWEMQIIWGEKRQRDGEKLGQREKIRCRCGNAMRQMREGEMRGNKGRQEERHYTHDLRGFCLHGCDVTHRQSTFWSGRSMRIQGFFWGGGFNLTSFVAHDPVSFCSWLYRSGTHTCTNTHMLVSVLDFLLQ